MESALSSAIGVRDLLKRSFDSLGERIPNQHFTFPLDKSEDYYYDFGDLYRRLPTRRTVPKIVIGRDMNREGSVWFNEARVFKGSSGYHAFAYGITHRGWLTEPVDSALLVFDYSEDQVRDFRRFPRLLCRDIDAQYNLSKRALLVATTDGSLSFNKDHASSMALRERMMKDGESKIAQYPESDGRLISLRTLSPLVTRKAMYSPELTDLLADGVRDIYRI